MARKISKEEVVEKLKDDGDFDRLRLKIIRRLKENEELRNNLISVVKESTALKRHGAQNMKTRQLSDAIFQQVGSKMLSQLSDGLWGIIRSEDGMKNEIRETVQSVYDTLSNPGSSTREAQHNIPIPKGETSSCPQINASKQKQEVVQRALEENKGEACSSNYIDNNCDEEDDPELPPGFG
uniref:BOD1/SHG1 domain-containing protein n=1 Tax=Noccaea caerulescens TaxID=107243 RepID=A0A1J3FB56_NOCCA